MLHIRTFNDFIDSGQSSSQCINNCILEMMHVSIEVSETSANIVKLIENISMSDLKTITPFSIEGHVTTSYTYKTAPVVDIFNRDCKMNLTLINIEDDIDSQELKTICRTYGRAKIDRDYDADDIMVAKTSYELTATIILNKMKMSKYMKSAIEHEMRHAYIYWKSRDGKDMIDVVSMDIGIMNWEDIYDFCRTYISNYNASNDFGYEDEFTKIVYALYSCDKEEVDAFTQQAYSECGNCTSVSDIKSRLRETDLWDVITNLKEVIDFLDDYRDKYCETIKKIKSVKLPRYGNLLNFFKKRYRQMTTRYGKIQIKLIDELKEDEKEKVVERKGYYSISSKGFSNYSEYLID